MRSVEPDRPSGAVFVVLAGLFAVPAFSYGMGSFARLGAGVFPLAVSILLGLVGVALILRSFAGEGDKVLPFDLRAMAFIVAGMLFGAFGLNRFGLVVAVPGGAGTRHLVDTDILAALGRRGIVVNIGRGSAIDEDALIRALGSGARSTGSRSLVRRCCQSLMPPSPVRTPRRNHRVV